MRGLTSGMSLLRKYVTVTAGIPMKFGTADLGGRGRRGHAPPILGQISIVLMSNSCWKCCNSTPIANQRSQPCMAAPVAMLPWQRAWTQLCAECGDVTVASQIATLS